MVLSPHTHTNSNTTKQTLNPMVLPPHPKQHPMDLQELVVIWISEPSNPPVQNTPGDVEFV